MCPACVTCQSWGKLIQYVRSQDWKVSSDMHTLSLSMLKSGIQDIYWMMLLILKHIAVSVMLGTSIRQGQTLALFPYEALAG